MARLAKHAFDRWRRGAALSSARLWRAFAGRRERRTRRAQMMFMSEALRLGFSLDEIGTLLRQPRSHDTTGPS